MEHKAKIGLLDNEEYNTILNGKVVTKSPQEYINIIVSEKNKGFITLGVNFKNSEHMPEGAIQIHDFDPLIELTIFNSDKRKIINEKPIFIGYIGDKEIYIDLIIELVGNRRREIEYIIYEGISDEEDK